MNPKILQATASMTKSYSSQKKIQTTSIELTQEGYEKAFEGKKKIALQRALDTRKFEIELYWKRATYFWTFIGATLAGFVAVQAGSTSNKDDLSVILSCLGLVFSFAWLLVNRGSKYWQENWEKHVDLLEDSVSGPLYKVVLSRNPEMKCHEKLKNLVTGPSAISVSKINQIVSLYVFCLWLLLLIYSLPPFHLTKRVDIFYVALVALSAIACVLFVWLGRSYTGGYWHTAQKRKSRIKPGQDDSTNEAT